MGKQNMSPNSNIVNDKKIASKCKRRMIIVKKDLPGLSFSSEPTSVITVLNAGLQTGFGQEEAYNLLHRYGALKRIVLVPNKSYGFVEFANKTSAQTCLEALQGTLISSTDGSHPIYLAYAENVPEEAERSHTIPPLGLRLMKDVISAEEETVLLSSLTWNKVDENAVNGDHLKHRDALHFGYKFLYDGNGVDTDDPAPPFPPSCDAFLKRCVEEKLILTLPDQLTVNKYLPGQGIPSHVDSLTSFTVDDPILILSLGSAIVMEFKRNEEEYSLELPARSLLILDGESRREWKHGIRSRKYDVIPMESGLSYVPRGTRLSFTFRTVKKAETTPQEPNYVIEEAAAPSLEAEHVHQVYDKIAEHFSSTRYRPWPGVLKFIEELSKGSVVVDVGCGNGKYLGVLKDSFGLGCDRSYQLCTLCREKTMQVALADCLYLPFRDNSADAVICIAVIHHLATPRRRQAAIEEIVRILRAKGRALIYVWAKEQKRGKTKSTYLKKSLDEETAISSTNCKTVEDKSTLLPIHQNRTDFSHTDVFVPWTLNPSTLTDKTASDNQTFHRYYHMFVENELDDLVKQIGGCKIEQSYYEQGNWCIVLEKL